MSLSSKVLFLLLLQSVCSLAQTDCNITISGLVIDQNTNTPIDHAHCVIAESDQGRATSDDGTFSINSVCPQDCHLIVSHVGCATTSIYLPLTRDTFLTIYLDHQHIGLDAVTVSAARDDQGIQVTNKVMDQSGDDGLADLLASLEGVSVLSTGNDIGKPIINGLYGNRLQIINAGLPHIGQSWGNDHAPEIDPSMVDRLSVVQGAAAVTEQASTLGTIVRADRRIIKRDPHVHGHIASTYSTNGRGLGLNGELYAGYEKWSWRGTASTHNSGDRHTPDYYLRNTGTSRLSGSGELNYHPHERLRATLLYTHYSTDIGILRGSHIGNTTDLRAALASTEPFFTQPSFDRDINNPRQEVAHSLVRATLSSFINPEERIEVSYGVQVNDRQEFDVRRGERSTRPTLSLQQIGQHFVTRYISEKKGRLESGIQITLLDNENVPGTGILPLIPNYLSFTGGAYAYYHIAGDKLTLDVGLRLDNTTREIVAISNDIPREIIRYNESFYNYQTAVDLGWMLDASTTLVYSTSLSNRNPHINELYSQGLHQGVSGIEEGNLDLEAETSILQALKLTTDLGPRVHLRARAYYRHFRDYIYLRPSQELRLTIRGAFPVYQYTQTDAHLIGLDATTSIEWSDHWSTLADLSIIRSDDLQADIPLVNIPTDHGRLALRYAADHAGIFSEVSIEAGVSHHASQSELLTQIEFAPPPDAYTIADLHISVDYPIGKSSISGYIRCSNLFNNRYRNYLNRLRYFADEDGRDVTLGINYKF